MAAPTIIEFEKAPPAQNAQGWQGQFASVRADQITSIEDTKLPMSGVGMGSTVYVGMSAVTTLDSRETAVAKWQAAIEADEAPEKRGRAKKEGEQPAT